MEIERTCRRMSVFGVMRQKQCPPRRSRATTGPARIRQFAGLGDSKRVRGSRLLGDERLAPSGELAHGRRPPLRNPRGRLAVEVIDGGVRCPLRRLGQELRGLGVRFVAVTQGIDSDESNPNSRLMLTGSICGVQAGIDRGKDTGGVGVCQMRARQPQFAAF